MRVLVVGGGGREHALVWALSRSPGVDRIVAAPGNAGMATLADLAPVGVEDVRGLAELAERERVDLVVIGPDAAVAAGVADDLRAKGIPAFGPSRAAGRIESSKSWAKDLCRRHGIPTASAEVFEDPDAALAHLESADPPYVVKADGLALGKGVIVAPSREEAAAAVRAAMVEGAFGEAGARVLIEEYLEGPEVSAFAITDGETVIPFAMAQDFKRAADGDRGPNTGGMGAYSPVPWVSESTEAEIVALLERTVAALADDGIPYVGCLYGGLILTADGPKVLEFNARFGDPETQAILPRLDGDLAQLLSAAATGRLGGQKALWRADACVTVILASGGYPGRYPTGLPIEGLEAVENMSDTFAFHAGTALDADGRVTTAGGRVLAVSALGKDLAAARERSYEAIARIRFDGMHHRTDIAKEAAGG